MARAGSPWVEGDDLHYLGYNTVEYTVAKVSVGANSNRKGSCWVESGQIHWINEDADEEFRTDESVFEAASRRDGSGWVEVSALSWIDENGDERRYIGDDCTRDVTYTLSTAGRTLIRGECHATTHGECANGANLGNAVTLDWTPKAVCTNAHMDSLTSINGGSYTSFFHGGGCNDSDRDDYMGFAGYLAEGDCNDNCDITCVTHVYRTRAEIHHTDEDLCDSRNSSATSAVWVCPCSDCAGGA